MRPPSPNYEDKSEVEASFALAGGGQDQGGLSEATVTVRQGPLHLAQWQPQGKEATKCGCIQAWQRPVWSVAAWWVWRERPGVWGLQEAGLNRWASTGREGAWTMVKTSFGGSVQEWCNDHTALIKEARSVRINGLFAVSIVATTSKFVSLL